MPGWSRVYRICSTQGAVTGMEKPEVVRKKTLFGQPFTMLYRNNAALLSSSLSNQRPKATT